MGYFASYKDASGKTTMTSWGSSPARRCRTEQAGKPLENYRDIAAFKNYVSDVGLLCAKKEIIPEDILYSAHELDDFKGGMTENYVCNQLVASGHSCYYWTGDHSYEVDFLVQLDGAVIPIEVKAAEHTQAKSLNAYRKLNQPALSGKNFRMEDGQKSVPLYAAFCL